MKCNTESRQQNFSVANFYWKPHVHSKKQSGSWRIWEHLLNLSGCNNINLTTSFYHMVHCSWLVSAMCLHSDTGWHEICHSLQDTTPSKCAQTLNSCCSFDMYSTRPYQTLVPCVFINISSQEDTVNTLGLWLWTFLNALAFQYPQWNICTFFYYFTQGCIPSSLQQFLYCYFTLFQFNSFKTLNITFWWRQSLTILFFFLRLPLHPYQCRTDHHVIFHDFQCYSGNN